MHEYRNFTLIVLFCLATLWGFFAWLVAPNYFQSIQPSLAAHQYASISAFALLGGVLVYVLKFEDRMDDRLQEVTMGRYYEQDGLCFVPVVRVQPTKSGNRAEISLYYQNRYSGTAEAVIHMRPPEKAFYSHRGARDVHFAFRCQPGAFGVIHQPVAVPHQFQGEIVEVELAAAVRWPFGKGDQLRSHRGEAVGTFDVDWAVAYRQSRHELGGEIELKNPAKIRLTLPELVEEDIARAEYINETLAAATS